jgi:hypothetical protein
MKTQGSHPVSNLSFLAMSAISWREQVTLQWNNDEVLFVLDQHAELDFYNASSLKQPSAGQDLKALFLQSPF